MTAIFLKLISAVMSVVVFLSGTFPGLFGGKEYIYPNGDGVTITDKWISNELLHDSIVIKDYEAYKALGDIGVDYNAEYFEENALAIITLDYQIGDEIYVKSIYKNGKVYEIEYYYLDHNLTMLCQPTYMTFIIEATNDTTLVHLKNLSSPSFIKPF